MFKMGISIFNGLKDYTIEENLEYIKKASDRGYEILFSSAHINEANKSYQDLQRCIDLAVKLNMKFVLDISKPAFDKMESLKGLYALRLDYGFSNQDIVDMSHHQDLLIELNASTLSPQKFEQLIDMGLNVRKIRLSFNYYPKKHTGHELLFVKQKVEYFHKYNVSVGAFIPSHIGFRPPMYEGLPTIEKHRNCSLDLAIEELKCLGVDEIIFGDAYAGDMELDILKKHCIEEILVNLTIIPNLDKWYVDYLNQIFSVRVDSNNELVRLNGKKANVEILPVHTIKREIGDVTIDNIQFLRYQGEINIVLQPLEEDERVNVIGHIESSEIILEKMKEKNKVRFLVNQSYESF